MDLRAAAFALLLGAATQFLGGSAAAAGPLTTGQASPGTVLPDAFKSFDTNRDGVLSATERSALRSSLAGARKDLLSGAPVSAPAASGKSAQAEPSRNTPRGSAQASAQRGPSARAREASNSIQSLRTAEAEDPNSEQDLQGRRRELIDSLIAKRNGSRYESHLSRVERVEERQSLMTDLEAYRFVMKNKTPAPAKTQPFRTPARQGVSHGKKRGSKYYTALLKKTGRAGRGGGRYGGGNNNYNKNYNY